MKTYLSHQSLNHLDRDIIVINGNKKEEYIGTTEQRAAFELLKPNDMRYCSVLIFFPSHNPNCSIYIGNNDELLMISNFLSKDEDGRLVTYSFYCDEILNTEDVVSNFIQYCNLCEMQIDYRDLKELNRTLFLHKYKKIIYVGMALITLIIFLIIIC